MKSPAMKPVVRGKLRSFEGLAESKEVLFSTGVQEDGPWRSRWSAEEGERVAAVRDGELIEAAVFVQRGRECP